MIDKDLLAILACPQTHQPLAEANAELLKRVNERISAGKAQTVGGTDVKQALAAGLVRQDGKVIYPVRDDIPVLLVDEGIALS